MYPKWYQKGTTGHTQDTRDRSELEKALAGRLRVEETVGLVGLIEPEPVRQELVERHLAVGDEAGALGLAHARKGPPPVDRQLPADPILADVEGRRVALAHECDAPPGGRAAHRGHARLGVAGAVHRGLDALALRQLAERHDRIGLARVDDRLGAEPAGERESFGGDVDGD